MKIIHRLASVFIGVSIAICLFPAAVTQPDLRGKANKITVKIIAEIPLPAAPESREKNVDMAGSGVIIAREQSTSTKSYYVLTADHVAKGIANNQDKVVTSDQRKYVIKQIFKLRGDLDLAVLKFNADKDYTIAELGDPDINYLRNGNKIYIAGWSEEQPLLFKFEEGTVTGIYQTADKGYTLRYDAPTANGMSGGPVINDQGRLVGIHGESDGWEQRGIPITTFLLTAPPEVMQALGRPIAPTISSAPPPPVPVAPTIPTAPSPSATLPRTLPSLTPAPVGVRPTIPPPITTIAPRNTTRPPATTTIAPRNTTRPPATTTIAPRNTTRPPATTTIAPRNTTRPPAPNTRPARVTIRRPPAPPRLPICVPNRAPQRTEIHPNLLQITANQTLPGSLNPGDLTTRDTSGRFRDYQLVGVNPGQSLEINLDARFDTYLQILDGSGRILCYNDDRRGGGRNSQLILNVSQGMNYVIRVTTLEGNATGSYTLRTRSR